MKRLMSLVLFLALVGGAMANMQSDRNMPVPPVNLQPSVRSFDWVGPYAMVWLRFFAPSYFPVQPKYNAMRDLIPVPPVCGVNCPLLPVEAIGK